MKRRQRREWEARRCVNFFMLHVSLSFSYSLIKILLRIQKHDTMLLGLQDALVLTLFRKWREIFTI